MSVMTMSGLYFFTFSHASKPFSAVATTVIPYEFQSNISDIQVLLNSSSSAINNFISTPTFLLFCFYDKNPRQLRGQLTGVYFTTVLHEKFHSRKNDIFHSTSVHSEGYNYTLRKYHTHIDAFLAYC